MPKKKILVWETLSTVSGGQKMTLMVMDLLHNQYDFLCLIPAKGLLSDELDKKQIPYILLGDMTLPTGVKGINAYLHYTWMSAKCIVRSLRAIRKYKPDILYAPGPAALPWSAVCGTLMRKPVVWHLHHMFLDGPTKKLLNICSKWKAIKRIIAVSRCVGEQVTAPSALPKIEVLYNPVDVTRYSSGIGQRFLDSVQTQYGVPLINRILIGHIALVQRSKQQSFVLEVIRKLREHSIDAVGLFAGEVREHDYEDELRQQIKEYGLEKATVLLGRREDIPDMLKALTVLMIPSSFEGFPLAGVEAAAAGTPVVACDVAGAREYIEVSKAGTFFRENDIEYAVSAVLSTIEQAEVFARNGHNFAESASLPEYCRNLKSVFDTV